MRNAALYAIEDSGLRGSQRLVALELAIHADRRAVVRIPQSEVATLCGLSRRTVANSYKVLEDQGFLLRLGHGRYKITESEFVDESATPRVSCSPEADAENERLRRIRQPHQGIKYRRDGWPMLVDLEDPTD